MGLVVEMEDGAITGDRLLDVLQEDVDAQGLPVLELGRQLPARSGTKTKKLQ